MGKIIFIKNALYFQAKHQSQSVLRHAVSKKEEGAEEQHSAIMDFLFIIR